MGLFFNPTFAILNTMKTPTILLFFVIILTFEIPGATGLPSEKNTLQLTFKDELVLESGDITGLDRSAVIKNIAINSNKQIVIATWQDAFLFIKNDRLLVRVGEKRPGKGYYAAVICLAVDSSDNIYIMDGYTVHSFDKSGKFIKNIPILPRVSHYFPSIYISPTGDIVAFFAYVQNNSIKLVLEHLNKNGKRIADIHSFIDRSAHIKDNGTQSISYHGYMEDYYMIPILNKEICFASNLEYCLHFYNPESKKHRTVIIKEKPMKIHNDELIAFKNLYKSKYPSLIFPKHRPFFQGLLSDEKGRIYVICTKSINDKDKKGRTLDVLNKHGNFLFRCSLPCMPLQINRGSIFFVSKKKGKPSQLRVLRVMNYEDIPY